MDRYYRAREGDDSMGAFDSIYKREYDLNKCNYIGLNEFLVPEVIDSVYDNGLLITNSPGRQYVRGKEQNRGGLHNVIFTTMEPDTTAKQIRRKILSKLLNKYFVLLKYPLVTNPKPEWDVDYISCERRGVRAQTKSLYLSMTTGCYHFKEGDERLIQRFKKFAPRPETLDRWTQGMEQTWKTYRAMKPKNCQTIFMEDFEHLKPFEVLELIGIMDWHKYLDKNFKTPIKKGWSS